MKRGVWVVAGVVVAFACGPDGVAPPEPPLVAVARAALECPVGALTWSTDIGSIDQAGHFTAPPCPTAPPFDLVAQVTVGGCGRTVTIPVDVSDSLEALSILCGVIQGETCCQPPPWTVTPGTQIQLYAALRYSCAGHVTYSAIPPPMCP